MLAHTRIRGIAVAALASALAFGGAGCLNPYVNPFSPYPYHYPPAPAYGPPTADKSRSPIPDNPTPVVPAQYQQPAPVPQPPPAAVQPPQPLPAVSADPHTLSRPTAGGDRLNLGPGELPMDRALDLTRRIDAYRDENLVLKDRVRALEAKAVEREQALNEAVRDVEAATLEVARTRTEFRVLRKEIETLRDRLKQVEKDEVETLKVVIAALERLLRQPDE